MHSEVSRVAATAAGSILKDRNEPMRDAAAIDVLRSIADHLNNPLFQEAGVTVEYKSVNDMPCVRIYFEAAIVVRIYYVRTPGEFLVSRRPLGVPGLGEERVGDPITLPFDPVAKAFVSLQDSEWIAPTPGQAIPQKPAAAKLLELAFAAVAGEARPTTSFAG